MKYGGRLSPQEFWARRVQAEERMRASAGILPCYGLVGWSGLRMVGDWQWLDGELVSVGLAHGAPDGDAPYLSAITTMRDPTQDAASLRVLRSGRPWDTDDVVRRLDDPDAGGEPASIAVDAEPVGLVVWRDGDRWWAAGHHRGYGVVLDARSIRVGEVALTRVDDIEPYITGDRVWLRERRGEA